MQCTKCQSNNIYTHGFYGSNRTPRFKCRDCKKTFSPRTLKPCSKTNLSDAKLYQVLNCLTEGCSIRATARLCDVHPDTVMRVLVTAGEKCERLMNDRLRGLQVKDVEADETYSFVYCKEATKKRLKTTDPKLGDAYTFIALERNSKLILAWHLGRRTARDTEAFIEKLDAATEGRFQLTTDGFGGYPDAVSYSLGTRVDYAQLVKVYAKNVEGEARYSPSRLKKTVIHERIGRPDPDRICTSIVERVNLQLRMNMRRLTRLTNGYSRKWENLKAALALFFFDYNFRRQHGSIKRSPAMAAGVTNHLWEWGDLFASAN